MKTLSIVPFVANLLTQPSPNGWDIFAKVQFTPQIIKEVNEYLPRPFFDSRIRFYEGKEMTLEGYYIPMELEERYTIILSKNPYAQCFFCGGAAPKSISEIVFASNAPNLRQIKLSKSQVRLG